MHSTSTRLASLLQQVLDGHLTIESVLENVENFEGVAAGCFHGLQHYAADVNIRAKDESYWQMQQAEMLKLIELLQRDADRKTLESIHFLGSSNA